MSLYNISQLELCVYRGRGAGGHVGNARVDSVDSQKPSPLSLLCSVVFLVSFICRPSCKAIKLALYSHDSRNDDRHVGCGGVVEVVCSALARMNQLPSKKKKPWQQVEEIDCLNTIKRKVTA